MDRKRVLLAGLLCAASLKAEKPAIFPGGVVNGATFAPASFPAYRVTPGCIASVFGTALAGGTENARSLPLPRSLAGTSVIFDGVAVPLFYVSPGQVNVQVPQELVLGFGWKTVSVVVTTAAGSSDPEPVQIAPAAVGVFTLNASGCGQAAVYNVAADGSVSLNSPENGVPPGGIITVWATGLGYVDGARDGEAPAAGTSLTTWCCADFDVPRTGAGNPGKILYANRSPMLVGVDQWNIQLPDDTVEACNVPLRLLRYYSTSQPVPVAVHRGGGACGPAPPPDSLGVLTMVKTVSSGLSPAPPPEAIQGEFTAAVVNRFPAAQTPAAGSCSTAGVFADVPTGPTCPGFNEFSPRSLDAGSLQIRAPGRSVGVKPAIDGAIRYDAALPQGTMSPGPLMVAGLGGHDAGRCCGCRSRSRSRAHFRPARTSTFASP